ncbi:hypothetical protein LX64_03875 [Chitinophaga skermanii]|uniref:Universal stress protein family protein n=1 Tax=Chitinophaga skermanii TaxID=331697 RepID=A0A327QIX0_9BACT|nr:hypothetical protein [Chitinophaga skermanii]RAJ01657.1 hypothetical protein LX64_03875 [Chitinophaga skermanii]
MKNVMIPTDLSIRSLSYLHNFAEQMEEPCHVVLMHAQRLPESILEYWQFTRNSLKHAQLDKDFLDAIEIMRNRYANCIQSMRVEFFYGTSKPALRNFLYAHQIDAIAIPEQLHYHHASESSFDPCQLIKGCKVPTMQLRMTMPRLVVKSPTSISALLGANH